MTSTRAQSWENCKCASCRSVIDLYCYRTLKEMYLAVVCIYLKVLKYGPQPGLSWRLALAKCLMTVLVFRWALSPASMLSFLAMLARKLQLTNNCISSLQKMISTLPTSQQKEHESNLLRLQDYQVRLCLQLRIVE